MIDLNDRRLVDDLFRQIDARVARALERTGADISFGTVDQVDDGSRKASVFLRGATQSSPGFSYGEHPPVSGDLVACLLKRDGTRMIFRILGRDIVTEASSGSGAQVSFPNSVAGAADYLARIKLDADTEYRYRSGLDASDRPSILMSDGATVDLRAYRSGAKLLTIDDGAGGAAGLNVIGDLKENGTDVSLVGHTHAGGSVLESLEYTFTGNVDDWEPTGFSSSTASIIVLRCDLGGSARTVTGIAAKPGCLVLITSTGVVDLTLMHQNTGSAAANRIVLPSGASYTVTGRGGVALWYDPSTLVWRPFDK